MGKDGRGLRVGWRLAQLTGSYPPADGVVSAAGVGKRKRAVLARLWISEGIPFAFRKCPALFEEVRDWLAEGLDLDAKQISVAGSGRLGLATATTNAPESLDGTLRKIARLRRQVAGASRS